MASTFDSFWNTASSYHLVKCDTSGTGTCAGRFSGAASANDSTILGGPLSGTGSHYIAAPCSTIVMGQNNKIDPIDGNHAGVDGYHAGGYNSIANGFENTASGYYSSIFGRIICLN